MEECIDRALILKRLKKANFKCKDCGTCMWRHENDLVFCGWCMRLIIGAEGWVESNRRPLKEHTQTEKELDRCKPKTD